MVKWMYGVTTCPMRKGNLLPSSLRSLALAGFDRPWLFVDGDDDVISWKKEIPNLAGYTFRNPKVRTFANWTLSMAEMYLREPTADYYALFQDDLLAYRNLRTYIERNPGPRDGYWNLYEFPSNQKMCCPKDERGKYRDGWYKSNQFGRGALGLIFPRDSLLTLLTQKHMVERPLDPHWGWKKVDGGIVTAMNKAGLAEYVHHPSLLFHTGLTSSMSNAPHKPTESWRGEKYDVMEILEKVAT